MTKKRQQGKHTEQSFYDMEAISLVSAWIAETQRAMPDLKALDKWPNIDGHIEITEKDGSPKGELRAQVKKLKKGSKNKLSFRNYKFLEHCRVSIDWTPIILIGVDLENREAYWLHIDSHFLSQGGDRKTITFVENQVIKSGTSEFIKSWEKIIAIYYSKHREFEKNKKLFFMLSDVFNPAYGKTDQNFVNIHYFLDELNGYLDHTLPIVKQIFYPNTWKLGFAYFQYENSSLAYSLYPIAQNQNDVQIKEINRTLFNKIKRDGLGFSTLASRNPIKTNPKEYAKEVLHRKTSQIIKEKLLEHSGSSFLAKEYVFAFIDQYRIQMGLEQKDTYSLEEIEMAFYTYLPFWLKFSADISSYPPNQTLEGKKIYFLSQIRRINGDKLNEVKRSVEKALQGNEPVPEIQIMDERGYSSLSFGLFLEFLHFLKQTRQREIGRPYKKKDFSILKDGTADWVWNLFSKKDTDQNLKVFFKHLLEVYDAILRNNFPALRDELPLFGEADTILVSWDLSDQYDHNGPTYYMYYLKSKTERKRVQIKLITKEDIKRYELGYPSSKGTIRFENEEYQLLISEYGELDFIYNHTPMLSFIYEKLKERIDEYFKKTEPGPKFDKRSEADWGEDT